MGEDEIISKINQSAESISIDANRININGTVSANGNFKIDTSGNMTCNNAQINGGYVSLGDGTKNNPTFQIKGLNSSFGYMTTEQLVLVNRGSVSLSTGKNTDQAGIYISDESDSSNNVTCTADMVCNYQDSASFSIQRDVKNGDRQFIDGWAGLDETLFRAYYGNSKISDRATNSLITRKAQIGNSYIREYIDNTNNVCLTVANSTNTTNIFPGKIDTPVLVQTSLENKKKNFEKLQSGLNIIKNIDIYKYNLKNEEDNTKKHIGFVIGDKYKYSKEITSTENDGADIYSFVSVCCKAIQEQQEEIEELKKEIEKLKGGK